jgi:hypothetical protein
MITVGPNHLTKRTDGDVLGKLRPAPTPRYPRSAGTGDQQGTLAAHVDPDVLTDMMVGAVLYRVMQPEPLDIAEAQRYLQAVYCEAGLPNEPADQEPC